MVLSFYSGTVDHCSGIGDQTRHCTADMPSKTQINYDITTSTDTNTLMVIRHMPISSKNFSSDQLIIFAFVY